ncbi:MAG: hypothetical protein ACMZ7B_04245 [Balneola sp.]
MKKSTKKIILILFTLFLVVEAFLIYDSHFSYSAKLGKQNLENIKLVQYGMTLEEVLEIMGEPETILNSPDKNFFVDYEYEVPPGSSAICVVQFGSTMKVKDIYVILD